jgi:SprT protein
MGQSKDLRESVRAGMMRYIPEPFIEQVVELFFEHPLQFKVVKNRRTKLGDFRAGLGDDRHRITVNGNLNPYSFLITTLHEFAHLHTYVRFGNKVSPHGEEWKEAYRRLLLPVINSGQLPKDVEGALLNSLVSVKASSCSDQQLMRVLMRYDKQADGLVPLEHLPLSSVFTLEGRKFVKGSLKRKRYVCEELSSKRRFLVHALAQVVPNKTE